MTFIVRAFKLIVIEIPADMDWAKVSVTQLQIMGDFLLVSSHLPKYGSYAWIKVVQIAP